MSFRRNLAIISSLIFMQGTAGIRVEEVVVPSVALAGHQVRLECHYKEEGDKLYSLKWWRGEDQFYQYVPPQRKFFPALGLKVNMSATWTLNPQHGRAGQETVLLDHVGLDTAGIYKCEVMADNNFQTEFKQANMSVVYAPEGPPTITTASGVELSSVSAGQEVSLNCSSPPAFPELSLSWFINDRLMIGAPSTSQSPVFFRGPTRVSSSLDFVVTPSHLATTILTVKCVAVQHLPSAQKSPLTKGVTGNGAPLAYRETATLTLLPGRRPLFWGFFSHGSCLQANWILTTTSAITVAVLHLVLRQRM